MGNASANLAPAFTADTAAKTGQSERAVQRDAARGNKINPEVLANIAGTKLDTGKVQPLTPSAIARPPLRRFHR